MAISGRKPKEEGQKVTRHALTQEWVDVPAIPYAGERPRCPVRVKATLEWWEDVTTMPHCALWEPADWRFAVDTSRIHAAFSRGDMARAQELRVRERIMGTTLEARRDLRIRYVAAEAEGEPVAVMTAEDEARWRKLVDDDDA